MTIVDNIEKLTLIVPPEWNTVKEGSSMVVDHMLVSLWFNDNEKDDATGDLRITTVTPTGKKVNTTEVKLAIKPLTFTRMLARVRTVPMFGPGVYYYVVHVKATGESRWKRVATIPLIVEYKVVEGAPMTPFPLEPPSEAGDEQEWRRS